MRRLLAVLLIVGFAIATTTAFGQRFSSYEDCILQSMQGVTSNVAAVEIKKACTNLFQKRNSKLRRLRDDEVSNVVVEPRLKVRPEDWDKRKVYTLGEKKLTTLSNWQMNCVWENSCGGIVSFTNLSSNLVLKKMEIKVKFLTNSGSTITRPYVGTAICNPHSSCKFVFNIDWDLGKHDAWYLEGVWGSDYLH